MPAVKTTLADLREVSEERFGDYSIALSDEENDLAVLRNPLRLDTAARKQFEEIGKRFADAQADHPDVEAARKKLRAARNRRNSAKDDASPSAIDALDRRVEEETAKVEAAIEANPPDVEAQEAEMRSIVHDMVRAAVADQSRAERLIEALGTDLPMHIALIEEYQKVGQMGEASPSDN